MRKMAWAAALAVVAAGIGTGVYQASSLAQTFSRFSMDTAAVQEHFINARGEPVMMFKDDDGDAAYWVRVTKQTYGERPGTIFLDGRGFAWADSGITSAETHWNGHQVYPMIDHYRAWVQAPATIRMDVQDALWAPSGHLYLMFGCEGDTAQTIPARPDPMLPASTYICQIDQQVDGEWVNKLCWLVDSDTHSNQSLMPGTYRAWWALVDDLGMAGDYIGPIEFIVGTCEE